MFEELPKAAAAGSQVRSSLPSTSNNGLRTVLIDVDSSLYIQNSESYDNIPTREEIEEAFNPGFKYRVVCSESWPGMVHKVQSCDEDAEN